MTTTQATDYQVPTDIPAGSFRAYDIRGEAGDEGITPNVAYAVGLAFGSEAKAMDRQCVIVARDGRLTGEALTQALIAGILQTGCDVINIGMVPTPILYFATNQLASDTGVMVTASHNPGHHNGFKMVLGGKTVTTEGVQTVLHRIVRQQFLRSGKPGSQSHFDIVPDYIDYIKWHVVPKRQLKVVIDCGNGVAGAIAPALYRAIGCDVVELFCDVDGHFPNHHPDPSVPDNLQDVIATVKAEKADIGLAFDGDADRIGVVTNEGDVIWPDRQMMLFSKDLLARLPGSDIVFDVKCSNNLVNVIRENGGNPIMYRTGHSLLKNKMNEIGAPLAGEMSGHIFYREGWFGFDDGLYVGARLVEILSRHQQTAAQLFHELPDSVNTPELKLPMAEDRKADFMQALLSQADFGDVEKITIDGLRVEFGNGWGLVRPSNTSPYLILRFEADTAENLARIQAVFREQLLKLDADLELPF